MIDGLMKSMFAMLGIDPLEAGEMVQQVVADIKSVDERLTRIEQKLDSLKGIPNEQDNGS